MSSPVTYPFPCECGAELRAAATEAGTRKPCGCGRLAEVPSLARLKAAVGESAASADMQVEQLLMNGRLPLEADCVVCGRATTNRLRAVVTCERQEVVRERTRLESVAGFLLFGLLGWLVFRSNRPIGTRGTDRIFDLPIRLCEPCGREVTTADQARDALRRTPLYAALLDKYPRASVGRPRAEG